ncbi:MAG: hypothetical protein MJE12_27820 [Alphaproteobacteria bacterium]|nr:hypothetical protein [Alphaproteobacteria bacterium]
MRQQKTIPGGASTSLECSEKGADVARGRITPPAANENNAILKEKKHEIHKASPR